MFANLLIPAPACFSVGTREVHNKLEKNRRAHLKECFEQLKKQLSLQPDEKKISNLSILHAAIRHIQVGSSAISFSVPQRRTNTFSVSNFRC